ncbi:MAG: hypothetical protein ACRDP6_20480 [Actinoallomurus sp.]
MAAVESVLDGFELGDLEGVGVADGAFVVAVGDGVGVGVSAASTGAVPLTRTKPVPTPMISGLRTDRASTAYNLLNDRL